MEQNKIVNISYLKKYQKEKRLNNRELAVKIGVHESTISRILNGKKGVGQKFIIGAFYHLEDIDVKKLFIEKQDLINNIS